MGSSVTGFNIGLIPKLEESKKYDKWALLVMSCLNSSCVWKYIIGTAELPNQYLKELDHVYKDRVELYYGNEDHVYKDRVELYYGKEAQARNNIVCTCSSYIQQSLHDIRLVLVGKTESSLSGRRSRYHHHIWMKLENFKYEHEPIEEWCFKYTSLLDKCASTGVVISED